MNHIPDTTKMVKLNPDMPIQELKLHCGEMNAGEVRVARAAIRWANSVIAALFVISPVDMERLIEKINAAKETTFGALADSTNFNYGLDKAIEIIRQHFGANKRKE